MQYTITAINGGEVTVLFADGSYANVRIEPDDTLAEIDELVGRYTNAYIVDDTPNSNIAVGDVRETIDWQAAQAARDAESAAKAEQLAAEQADIFNLDWGATDSVMSQFTAYILAQKLAAEGDTSFLDMINSRVDAMICHHSDYNLDELKAAFNDTL